MLTSYQHRVTFFLHIYIFIAGPSPAPPQQGYQQQSQPYSGGYPAAPPPGYQQPQQPYQPPPQQHQMGSPTSSGGGLLSNCQGNKKALLIGINYFGQSGELRGCINDVNNIKNLIRILFSRIGSATYLPTLEKRLTSLKRRLVRIRFFLDLGF